MGINKEMKTIKTKNSVKSNTIFLGKGFVLN